MTEIPDELIELEQSAEEERAKLTDLSRDAYDAQLRRWREASLALQAGITAHAAAAGVSWYAIEQAVRQAVLHPQDGQIVE
ncbi:hypothetical protein [Streptomyces sp. NPDC007205]|uniref:hypothetical protein n=1 Tax=Streptomyces sp. NPDC007205 TaxID=3154316 RepID=UPI00340D6EFD